jgi:pyruvate kinase
MLSGDFAMGKYPVDAVAMLAKIAAAVEPYRPSTTMKELCQGIDLKGKVRPAHLIVLGVESTLEYMSPAAVFEPTVSGAAARRIGGFHLPIWIVAVCSQETTCQQLQFSSGVYPVHEPEHPENWNPYVKKWIHSGFEGILVVLTEALRRSTVGRTTSWRSSILPVERGHFRSDAKRAAMLIPIPIEYFL